MGGSSGPRRGKRVALALVLVLGFVATGCADSGESPASFEAWLEQNHGMDQRQASCLSGYVFEWWDAGTAARIRADGIAVLGGDDRSRYATALVACTLGTDGSGPAS